MSIVPSTLSNRLAKITMKNLKTGDGSQLRKIVDSFNHFVEKKDEQSLLSNFTIGHSKLNKQEKLTIKTDSIKSEKYPSLKTSVTRRKGEDVENFANNGFSMGKEMGELLKSENRNVHLSPRRIYDKGKSVNPESLERYKKTLRALSQNELTLKSLSKSTEAKILKNGKFRIQKKGNEYIPYSFITLEKKCNQTQDEFISEAVQFTKLIDEYSSYVNPNIALNQNPFKTHILPNGLEKYKQSIDAFKHKIEAERKLKNIAGVHVNLENRDLIRVTDAYGRQYILKNFSSEPDTLIQDATQFSENVALAGHNISPALMLKSPLFQTFSKEGSKKFDQAAAIFKQRSQEIDDFKRHGVYIKLRHNNSFRISRYVNNVQVFEKNLNPKLNESLEDLISRGFDCAELLKSAPTHEQKNVFHKLDGLFKKRTSLPPLKPSPHVPVHPNMKKGVTEQKVSLEQKSEGSATTKAESAQREDLAKTNIELPQEESGVHAPIQVEAEPVQLEKFVKNDTPKTLTEHIHSNQAKSPHYQNPEEELLGDDLDIPWHLQEMKPRKLSPEQVAQRLKRQEQQPRHHSLTWRRLSPEEIAQKNMENLHLKATSVSEGTSNPAYENIVSNMDDKQLAPTSSTTYVSTSDESFQGKSTLPKNRNSNLRRLYTEKDSINDKFEQLTESRRATIALPDPKGSKHFRFANAKENSNTLGQCSVLSRQQSSGNSVAETNMSKVKMMQNLKSRIGGLFKQKTQVSQ